MASEYSAAARYDFGAPRMPGKREQGIVDECMREFAQMQTWRHTFASQWEEVAELVLPTSRNTFEFGNFNWPGEKKTQRQIDATGMMALHRFAAICDSLETPATSIWHGLAADDEYVMKDRATRLWFEQATKALFKLRYAPNANFVSQNQNDWLQLGAFGTAGLFIDEFDFTQYPYERGIRYKSIPLGELFIRENHQGLVDGFIRWFRLTARQAWQKWGDMGTFPEVLRAPLEADSQTPFNFLHRVAPRSDYDPERLDARGKPWASFYLSLEGRSLLSEGGYRRFPAAISRYEQAPGEVFGRSPAMMVLPSLKTLNAEKRTFLTQGHRAAAPVLLTADDGIVDVSLRPGALNKGGVSADGKALVHVLPSGQIQISKEMMDEERALIQDAFLVNLFQLALNLKDLPQMTATQVIEIMNQKSILLAPTIGRQQAERLGAQIVRELDLAEALGALPPKPPRLREAEGRYKIVVVPTSPLSRSRHSGEAAGFMRAVETSKEVVNITQDPSYLDWADFDKAMPEIARIQGTLESWISSDQQIAEKRRNRAQAQQRREEIQAAPAKAAIMKAQAVQAKAGIGTPPGQQPAAGGPPIAAQLQGA